MLPVIDLSQWQETTPPLDGFAAVILRASIALTKDTEYDDHYANARALGLPVAAYHFGYPAEEAAIKDQVAKLLAVAKDADDLVIDQEKAGFSDAQTTEFIDRVHQAGRTCILYHSASGFGGVEGHDGKWVADYRDESFAAGHPLTGNGDKELPGWDIWQWSSGGKVPGYKGRLDFNVVNPASSLIAKWDMGLVPASKLTEAHTALGQALFANAVLTGERDALKAEGSTLRAALNTANQALAVANASIAEVEATRSQLRAFLGLNQQEV